jgi:preprotein translocase subunit SecE
MAKSNTKATKRNFFVRVADYFRNVVAELKRVVWPTRPEVFNSSLVVIATLAFFVVFTLLVDQAAIFVVSLIAGIGG